jgi:hypothetical protein
LAVLMVLASFVCRATIVQPFSLSVKSD